MTYYQGFRHLRCLAKHIELGNLDMLSPVRNLVDETDVSYGVWFLVLGEQSDKAPLYHSGCFV